MSDARPAFLFVHGAWHNAATWRQVIAHLETRQFVARALDLPGAGVHAKVPKTYGNRPLDLAAFAAERSPNAAVTQDERTKAVVSLIDEICGPVGAPLIERLLLPADIGQRFRGRRQHVG